MTEVAANTDLASADPAPVDSAVAEGEAAPAPEQHWSEILKQTMFRMMFFWVIMNWFRGGSTTTAAPKTEGGIVAPPQPAASNLFPPNMFYDIETYLGGAQEANFNKDFLFWKMEKLTFGLWTEGDESDSTWFKESELDLNEFDFVRNNGSLFLHTFMFPHGASANPKDDTYRAGYVAKSMKKLNKIKKRKYQETKNLLSGSTEKTEDKEKSGTVEWISHWHSNITISPIYDYTQWPPGKIPERILKLDIQACFL